MNILIILAFPNPFAGAGWIRLGYLAEGCSSKGHTLEFLGAFTAKYFHKHGIRRKGKIVIMNLIPRIALTHPLIFILNFLSAFITTFLTLLARRPHVIVVSMPPGDAGLGSILGCRLLAGRIFVDYRDEWEDYALSLSKSRFSREFYESVKNLAAFFYRGSKQVVTVTPALVKSLRNRGIETVSLMPNGADIRVFKPSKRNRSVSSSSEFDIVVEALNKIVNELRDVKLVIIGDGGVSRILELASKLGVRYNVEYLGVRDDRGEVARIVAEADVGVIPYDDNKLWRNSLPAKFFEYCACGIPVIAMAHEDSLLAQLIRENRIGLVVPPMNPNQLGNAFKQLYQDAKFREEAGRRARTMVEQSFDRNKISEAYLKLLETIVEA